MKTLTSSNCPTVQYFFAETSHTFPTCQCLQKSVQDFFILFRSLVISKNLKRPGFYTLMFYIFINNSRFKQNKKNPEHPFVDIVKDKTRAKCQQKISKSMAFGVHQSFQFFREINWFLGNNRALT